MLLRYRIKAYMTLEAALVMPVVIALMIFTVYFMFFRYNRCLMEQDLGILIVQEAAFLRGEEENELLHLREKAMALKQEKYLCWENAPIEVKRKGQSFTFSETGTQKVSFLQKLIGDGEWAAGRTFENTYIDAARILRQIRKKK